MIEFTYATEFHKNDPRDEAEHAETAYAVHYGDPYGEKPDQWWIYELDRNMDDGFSAYQPIETAPSRKEALARADELIAEHVIASFAKEAV